MADRYNKTEIGRAEIRARVHALTRTARNLLLIIDPSRDGLDWVGLVQGATPADLQTLVEAGLVELHGAAGRPAAPVPVAEAAAPEPAATVATEVGPGLTYPELYDLLPALAKEHLGLMKGYRFALSIEKANGIEGLRQVAADLVAEVERVKGAAVARAVKRALMLP